MQAVCFGADSADRGAQELEDYLAAAASGGSRESAAQRLTTPAYRVVKNRRARPRPGGTRHIVRPQGVVIFSTGPEQRIGQNQGNMPIHIRDNGRVAMQSGLSRRIQCLRGNAAANGSPFHPVQVPI